MKKTLPYILLIASAILILVNFITSEKIDVGFWMSSISSILIIIAMVLTIRAHKKQDSN